MGVLKQRVAEPPGGSSTTTAHDASQGAGHGPTVNNKEQHPPNWNDYPPCPLVGTVECGLRLYRRAPGESVDQQWSLMQCHVTGVR